MKTEIICITRHGFDLLHTEGADFAAKVTEIRWEPGRYDPRVSVTQERLIPLLDYWGE